MKTLSYDKLCQLSREALASPRLRMNSNFHTQLSDPIQRLAIAMEPGTYIRPHRHSATWELLSPLRGRFVVLTFDDAGQVSQRAVLGEDISAVEIPQAGWHAVLSLDVGASILEVKRGPYAPFRAEDFAPWSNDLNGDAQASLMAWYRHAQIGQRWEKSA